MNGNDSEARSPTAFLQDLPTTAEAYNDVFQDLGDVPKEDGTCFNLLSQREPLLCQYAFLYISKYKFS